MAKTRILAQTPLYNKGKGKNSVCFVVQFFPKVTCITVAVVYERCRNIGFRRVGGFSFYGAMPPEGRHGEMFNSYSLYVKERTTKHKGKMTRLMLCHFSTLSLYYS